MLMLDLLADLLLASDANKFEVLIKESLLIKRDGPVLNRTIKPLPQDLFD